MRDWRALVLGGLMVGAVAQAAFPVLSGLDLSTGKQENFRVPAGHKALAVVFLSAKCPCSRSHEPILAELAEQYPDISFLGIHSNKDEDRQAAKAHFQQAKLPFAVLQDTENRWADQYGAFKTPHLFLIAEGGEVLYRGGVDDSRRAEKASRHYLAEALDAVEKGRRPEVAESRALGCVIPR